MKNIVFAFLIVLSCYRSAAQSFIRSELSTQLNTPWEITYGPDNFLWISEAGGKVSRVDPTTGNKTVVYTAADYFGGSSSEQLALCFNPNIGAGTMGLALHPDFMNSATSYIYYLYSYNSGTTATPATKFKMVRLKWDSATSSVTANMDLILQLPTGYDHLGGRLLAIKRNNIPYLFLTCGDNGVSETNAPACYAPQSNNPNNFAQDPNYKNGKVHRFNIDGSIPADNPIPGNSFYTRGHRNPQGLVYNAAQDLLYDIEHGDQTDDEINILQAGMNYGWKYVRGYHADNNFPGEAAYISNYMPHPAIAGDALKEAMFAWCAVPQPTSTNNNDWCTVAPSDGVYYNSSAIPGWANSLLVVTLKDLPNTNPQLFVLKLNASGTAPATSTPETPNPASFFGSDKALNGRLRDIAVSPDGKSLYLVNNGGGRRDKITVYTYDVSAGLNSKSVTGNDINVYPNPASGLVQIDAAMAVDHVQLLNLMGAGVKRFAGHMTQLDISDLAPGIYFINVSLSNSATATRKIIKQ